MALGKVTICSIADAVEITASKGIKLGDGSGAYLKIADGIIELASTSVVKIKGSVSLSGPGGEQLTFPTWDGAVVDKVRDNQAVKFSN